MAQVSYGTITITDTNDINRIYVEYCRSTSNQLSGSTVPGITVNWSESTPAWVDGQYLWQRAVIEKSGTLEKTYGTPVCITGAQGETGSQGSTGAAGRSLTSTTTQYTTAATNATITQSNMGNYTWSSNVPTYNSSTPAYWVRITNIYSNPSSTEYIIYKDNGITDAVKTSHDANTTASAANTTANSANTTANNANTKADNAVTSVNNLQNKLKYYWVNEVAHTNGVSGWTKPNYPAGTYAASGISGTTFDAENSSTYGYNTWYANGINLRYNAIKLGELTGSALTFYQPSTTNQGAKAMELSGSALKFYASNGTTVQAEFGGSKARVSGTINAYDGQIGNSEDNYWYIGNYLDYFENQSAIIKSHGTASIQLGDSNTWRIATNRIHTAWNNDSSSGDAFKLHFPVYDNKYWDSGLHLPTSANDKLLYIRNSSSSNTLTYLNEALEDQYTNRWNYLFYITNSGSIYAKNIYVLDDNGQATQIGGTDGVYLLKSGGTITGDLTVNGTITGTLSGTATRVSKDLKIQLNGGTTEGTNQFTYNGSAAKTINITKSSVGLSNVENTALSTWAGSSNLTTTKVGTLAAAAVKGVDTSITSTSTSTNLPTSAAVATLIRGYLPLTGGNVTGAVTFGSSVSVDELTAGDLVINGAASFTNNLQANTINGVEVGSSPKFTDTVTTVTTSGNGNAVTAITASNGKLTVTKGTTFLTSYTETDPIFVASAAHGITSSDISNWNSKTSNTGTVTSVAASGSGGVTISGSPITTSGTITIGLNLSTAINGLGEGTSPATRDDYIVAQYAGGGTTTTTYHRRKLSNIFAALNSSDITTALGYTPYNSTNPNGYITANHTSTYSLPIAKYNTLGGVKPAYSSTGAVSLTTAAATNTTTPTIAAKTTTSGRYYAIEVDKNGVLFVNVPWTNVNSSYLTSSSTLNWNNITQNKPTTANGYGITDAITNVSATSASGGSTTFTLTKSNGTTSSFDVVVYASAASQATDANYLTDGTTRYSVGSAKKPIYFDGGIPKASDGTEGTSTKPVYLSSGTITAGSTYAGGTKVTLNNSDKGASTASFYAPTSGGTSTQVLTGNGTTSAPVWTSISSLVPSNATNATNDSDGNQINTTYIKKSIGTAAGDIIYWSAASTPTRLAKGSNGQVLKLANGVPTWGTDNNDNTTYSLSGSLSSHKFTTTLTPSSGSATTSAFTLAAGSNISLTDSGTTITIAATDVKVTQTNSTGNADYRLLFSENANDTTSTETTRKSTYLKFNPSSGLLKTYGISSASGSTPVIYSDVSAAEIKEVDSSLTTSSSDSDWLKALLIALCNKYPGKTGYIFKGTMSPNSVGWYEVHIYSTSAKDSTTGLPQYSFGRFLKYINNYSLFGTASYSYSYRTVDTNTWNPLTTSQSGYVSTAPNDTKKFLCGDATWAQVSSANLSDIRLTWSSSVSTTDWILAHDTAATGTPLFRAMSPANLKTTMSLNNVENTKLSTWAGSSNITTVGTISSGTWNGSAIPVANGGTGATTAANARTNLGLGTAATYTAATSVGNNSNLPTGAAIQTYVSGVVGSYVTLGTDQTITANQKTFNGAIRWGTASKYGAAHYDSTLEAIVFSFV